MSGSAAVDLQYLYYNAGLCLPDMVTQWFDIIKVYVGVALAIRMLAVSRLIPTLVLNSLATGVGIWLIWFFHGSIVWYFIALPVVSYFMYVIVPLPKGPLVGGFALIYIAVCEFVLVDAIKWHEMRGAMLLLIMKLVALGFDVDSSRETVETAHMEFEETELPKKKGSSSHSSSVRTKLGDEEREGVRKRREKDLSVSNAPKEDGSPRNNVEEDRERKDRSNSGRGTGLAGQTPTLLDVLSYTLSPLTTMFGPFLTFKDHQQFLSPAPLRISWLLYLVRCLLLSFVWLCVSVCIAPDIFLAPTWNKWLVAYSSALSFRTSHYFIAYLSEAFSTAGGLGFNQDKGEWGALLVVKPFDVEVPRSMGTIANSWNLSMYRFLKYYVYKPSVKYLGRFGAYLTTYIVSSMLHGLNFQLAAVLLSIGLYGYIENVFRGKLSRRLSACVLDRPCKANCNHRYQKYNILVIIINLMFTFLSMFHLAYLGQMFVSDPDSQEFDYQGFSIWHTLRHWYKLDFLSHFVAAGTFLLSLLL